MVAGLDGQSSNDIACSYSQANIGSLSQLEGLHFLTSWAVCWSEVQRHSVMDQFGNVKICTSLDVS